MIKFEPWLHYKCTTTNVHQIDFNDCISQIIHDYYNVTQDSGMPAYSCFGMSDEPKKNNSERVYRHHDTYHLLP